MKKVFCAAFIAYVGGNSVFFDGNLDRLYAEERKSESLESKLFTQIEPLPSSIVIGVTNLKHRFGVSVSSYDVSNNVGYSGFGIQYARHLVHASIAGPYGKVLAEHRQFKHGFSANPHYSEEKNIYEYDVIESHEATQLAAILGYQWLLFVPRFYVQTGLGWQYNTNPVNIGPTTFGIGQSIKERQGATGELGFGILFD